MHGSEPAFVFEDREIAGQWRVEKFDADGGCEVEIFTGPDDRDRAIRHAVRQHGGYVEKRLKPYRR